MLYRKLCKIMFAFLTIAFLLVFSGCKKDVPCFSSIAFNMGYTDVETVPFEVVEITIPETFGKVYLRYNELLKEGGYDLSSYKGKKCLRYTYRIPSQNARANILVYNGKIIGGDISGITIDSVMIPIDKSCEING